MSPFYLVLYIFIALIVLLCVVSFAMYMCHVCSGVCGDNSDFEANGIVYLDERQPFSNTESNLMDDDPDHVTNVREFARKYEENLHNEQHSDNDERTLSNLDCSINLESNSLSENTIYKKKYCAPPVPPKPTVPVMIHSQPSSKKNSTADPPPYGIVTSNQSTPYRSSPCTPDRHTPCSDSPSRSISAPKRKPPPPPPPPKPAGLTDDFLAKLPPPRDSMLPPPDLPSFRDSVMLPPPPTDNYLSDNCFHPGTDNYLSDCD